MGMSNHLVITRPKFVVSEVGHFLSPASPTLHKVSQCIMGTGVSFTVQTLICIFVKLQFDTFMITVV